VADRGGDLALGPRTPRRAGRSSNAYPLDTSVLIDHAEGRPDGVAILARVFEHTAELYTCDVVTSEALSGGDEEERRLIARLLDALEHVSLDPEGARWAGRRRHGLRSAGRRCPLADVLIAATAWRLDATIVTRNVADFERFGVPVLGYGTPAPDDLA
jgi:predicted nucleic acid-binding protein